MRRERTQSALRRANRGNVPGHLGMAELAMLTAPHVAQCTACRRKTWEPALAGHWCGKTGPDGTRCQGVFEKG